MFTGTSELQTLVSFDSSGCTRDQTSDDIPVGASKITAKETEQENYK